MKTGKILSARTKALQESCPQRQAPRTTPSKQRFSEEIYGLQAGAEEASVTDHAKSVVTFPEFSSVFGREHYSSKVQVRLKNVALRFFPYSVLCFVQQRKRLNDSIAQITSFFLVERMNYSPRRTYRKT